MSINSVEVSNIILFLWQQRRFTALRKVCMLNRAGVMLWDDEMILYIGD